MAVTKSKVTKKKKVTKNLDKGAAYIHASFNNTIITITDNLVALEKALLMLHNKRLKSLLRAQKNKVLNLLKYM